MPPNQRRRVIHLLEARQKREITLCYLFRALLGSLSLQKKSKSSFRDQSKRMAVLIFIIVFAYCVLSYIAATMSQHKF